LRPGGAASGKERAREAEERHGNGGSEGGHAVTVRVRGPTVNRGPAPCVGKRRCGIIEESTFAAGRRCPRPPAARPSPGAWPAFMVKGGSDARSQESRPEVRQEE